MSFDLHFVPSDGESFPDRAAFDHWIKKNGHFVAGKEKGHNGYENESTGVYFSLYRSKDALDLNLNFCRPTFFAFECFEVMADFAKTFALQTIDPQSDGEPQPYNAEALIASWKKGNRFACSAMRQVGNDLPFMEESKATVLWRYLRAYPRLKETYDETFVPQVLVVLHAGEILRGAHLTRPTNYIVPPVDVFWLDTNGIVRADRVMKVLAKYLEKVRGNDWLTEIPESVLFDTDVMDVWESMYDSLKPEFMLNKVSRVEMDGFVDVNK